MHVRLCIIMYTLKSLYMGYISLLCSTSKANEGRYIGKDIYKLIDKSIKFKDICS